MGILTSTFDSFGLDIGDRSLKAVYLKKYGDKIVMESSGEVLVPKGVFDQGAIIKADILCQHINKLLENCGPERIKTKHVHACLPETHTFIKLLTLENTNEKEISAVIREELPQHVPLEIDETYLDYTIVPQNDPNATHIRVLVGAIPQKTSDSYTQALRGCGLTPLSLQIEAQAMLASLLPDDLPDTAPVGVVDIGATRTSFVLYDHASIQFTVSVPIAGDELTTMIAASLKLSPEEAKSAKHTIGLDPKRGQGSLKAVLEPAVKNLASAIQKNSSFYQEHFQNARPLTTILLAGGGSLMPGLVDTLRKLLPGITIAYGNPLHRLHHGDKLGLSPSFATAIGLGLANIE